MEFFKLVKIRGGTVRIALSVALYLSVSVTVAKADDPCKDKMSPDKLLCILYGEIGTFKADDGPGTGQSGKHKELCERTAKVALCRDNAGVTDGIACVCPNLIEIPKGKATWRTLQYLAVCAQSESDKFNKMSKKEKEEYCKGSYHFYHHKDGDKGFTGYMTPEIFNDPSTGKIEGLEKWGESGTYTAAFPKVKL